jgi:hypothetical protein
VALAPDDKEACAERVAALLQVVLAGVRSAAAETTASKTDAVARVTSAGDRRHILGRDDVA